MTRTILSGLLAILSVCVIGITPTACQSGGVGDPCTPEDEYNPQFSGFDILEHNIESRSFQCQTRICLVNHFQGRVSCPLGQVAPTRCNGPNDLATCGGNAKCVEAATLAPSCDPTASEQDQRTACADYGACNKAGKFCECIEGHCSDGFVCDPTTKQCKAYVCHKPGNCQTADNKDASKDCCLPGTDTPVAQFVCGQCAPKSNRNADQAVYCSCRCGPAEGESAENANFCSCPNGYSCEEIRRDLGISDAQLAGKYCIKTGTKYPEDSGNSCGEVTGQFQQGFCKGIH
jgi:hypothetical protein